MASYAEHPVLFDVDHDGGSREQTGWVSAHDGIVVVDLNGNGRIVDISETLSEYFRGHVGVNGAAGERPFANAFDALAAPDSNANGRFDAGDAEWNAVRVWA